MTMSPLGPHRVRLAILLLAYLASFTTALPSSGHGDLLHPSSAGSASSLLLNQPAAGDSLRLSQPSVDWQTSSPQSASAARRREKAARLARTWGVSMSEGAPRQDIRAAAGQGMRRSRKGTKNSTGRRGTLVEDQSSLQAHGNDNNGSAENNYSQNPKERTLEVGLSESRDVTQEQQHRHMQDRRNAQLAEAASLQQRDAQLHLDAAEGSNANINEPRSMVQPSQNTRSRRAYIPMPAADVRDVVKDEVLREAQRAAEEQEEEDRVGGGLSLVAPA